MGRHRPGLTKRWSTICAALGATALCAATLHAQQDVPRYEGGVPVAPTGIADNPLPEGPFRYRTAEGMDIRVEVVVRDIEYPMALAFLPGRDMLIVTRKGEVVLIMGLPGAGKSTAARAFVEDGYARLNRDDAGGTLRGLLPDLQRLVEDGASRIVLDNTYMSRASRASRRKPCRASSTIRRSFATKRARRSSSSSPSTASRRTRKRARSRFAARS